MDIIKAQIPDIVVGYDPKAVEEKDELVLKAKEFVAITSASDADRASRHCQAMKRLVSDTEKDRKRLKSPINDLAKSVDASAKKFVLKLDEELKRIGGLINAFKAAEEEKLAEEKRRRDAEIQKKLLEAQKAEEEAKAKEAEAVSENAGLSEAEEAILAEEEAKRKREEAEAMLRAKEPEKRKITGTISRKVVKWEILDVEAVFASHPDWFELVPKRSKINDCVSAKMEVPGMRIWEEAVTAFRA
jgi:hypothetical protein